VIAHDLRWLAKFGIRVVVVDVRPSEAAGLTELTSEATGFGLDAVHLVHPDQPGSASALRAAREFAGEGPIVVVDSGRLFAFDLGELLRDHAESPAIATMAVEDSSVPGPLSDGALRVEVDRTGRVVRFSPASHAPELHLVGAGCAVVEPRLADHVPADRPFDLERDLFGLVMRSGGVLAAHRIHGRSFELDTPEALEAASLAFSR
jgi:NDP-sugar pyrophosphorylase family protein